MEHIIVDGYNLLKCKTLEMPAGFDLEGQRDFLIRRLLTFCAQRCCKMTVVFDNSQLPPSAKSLHSTLKIIYASPGREADDVIKKMVRNAKKPANLTVITSDRAIRFTAKDHGVSNLSSQEFARMMRTATDAQSQNDPPETQRGISAKYHADIGEDEVRYWKALFEKDRDDE